MLPIATLSLLSVLTIAPADETAQVSPAPAPITTILPIDTPLVGLVNTKPEAWKALSRFQLFQAAFTATSQFLPPDFKFNYTKDVESWLGDQVALAFMPKTSGEVTSLDSSFLMLAAVKDDSLLQKFLAQLKADTKRQYKGITILEWKAPEPATPTQSIPPTSRRNNQSSLQPEVAPNPVKPNPLKKQYGLSVAILPGYIVTANTAKPIEQLINSRQASASLAQNPQFQKTLQQSQANQALFTLYQDPVKFLALLNDVSKDPGLAFPPLGSNSINSEQLKEYSTIDAFLSAQPEGLRFQINAYRKISRPDQVSVFTPGAEKILARMPAATYSAVTGRALNQQWQSLVSVYNAEPQLKNILSTLRNFVRTRVGLDVDQDIMSWMDGEYAFFLFPTKRGLFRLVSPNSNLGVAFVVQTSNRPAAETTLKKLDQFIKSFSQGAVTANNRSIKGKPVTSWDLTENAAESLLAYSWVDDNTIIVTTGLGAIADLVPQPYVLLPKTYNFTTATSSLPRPNEGYFYMNMGSFLSWVYGLVPFTSNDQNFQTFKGIIGAIYSISATTSVTAEQAKVEGLVVLAPVRKQKNQSVHGNACCHNNGDLYLPKGKKITLIPEY